MEIELSVIIPAYNIEPHILQRCVDSMQFISELMPYEIWIVDDGSQEDYIVQWVEGLQQAHIHAIRQSNMGPGGARNTGIEHAQGRYLTFVDADDYLLYGTYYTILKHLLEKQPDILCHGSMVRYEGPAVKFMMERDICPSCCSYIIRRETLGTLRFTPHIYHEDEQFCTLLHLRRAHLLTVPENGYFYRYRPESITHNPELIHKRFQDFLTVLQNLQQTPIAPTYRPALERRLDIMAMCYLVTLMRDTNGRKQTLDSLRSLRAINLYPLPRKWHGIRYFLLRIATIHPWLVVCITPLAKQLILIHNSEDRSRSFIAHIDKWK